MQTFIHELKQASPGGKVQPQMDTVCKLVSDFNKIANAIEKT